MAVTKITALDANEYLGIYAAPSVGAGSVTVNLRNTGSKSASLSLALVPQASLTIHSATISTRGNFTATPAIDISGATSEIAPITAATFRVKNISSIVSGGTGYVVSDVLTLSGGSFTAAATLLVTGVNGSGAITSASLQLNGAEYTALLSDPVTVTGGTGSGATFSFFWELDTFTITGNGFDGVPIVKVGSGSNAAVIDVVMSMNPSATNVIDAVTDFGSGTVLERTGMVINKGWMLAAKGANCSAAVWGFEQV